MRTSPWADTIKLHRQILDINLTKGSYFNITIDNKFPSWKWDGEKKIILATVSFIGGGYNSGISLAYIHLIAGGLSAIAGLYFWIKSLTVHEEDKDTRSLKEAFEMQQQMDAEEESVP